MPPHVRRRGTRGRSNTPRHAAQARAGLSAGRSAPRTQSKFAAFDEFCKRLVMNNPRSPRPRKQYCPQVAKPKLVCRTVELPKPDPLHIPMEALTQNTCTWSFGDPRDE